ncbi:GNAT family N-acetyltransferase [Rossellomorea aquimaris]|uniref:GNAT family N-acetyltransferase n=1 Tax=Rossellomorea aquimaris TaxID=189382 RepID=UPI001CD2B1B5|nr:GNAT family N-acetyltransferase [Rossellomorea aquimaris]MCA1055822.1 GNAT family N-acetyltransferase [Rossellomorea aquimaris]
MIVRDFLRQDALPALRLFKETIRQVNLGDYSEGQVEVWSNSFGRFEEWEGRLERHRTIVAEDEGGLTGFVSLDREGVVDLLYVHKDYQRRGIASRLLDRAERYAASINIHELYTEASLTARPFFEKHGYKIVRKQTKQVKGVDFINFIMCKKLK